MTKQQAVALLGGSPAALARALGLTRARISQWPEELKLGMADRVVGAATRLRVPNTQLRDAIACTRRMAAIQRLHELGASQAEIARRQGVSVRQVKRILSTAP